MNQITEFFPNCEAVIAEAVGPVLARAVDQPFGVFTFSGRAFEYRDLPAQVKGTGLRWVYYGKACKSLKQARDHASRIFTFGRETRGAAHGDVWKHLKGINQAKYGTSGFMQTGRIREVIERKYVLGKPPAFGLLYVIDAKGAEVLDVDALSEYVGSSEPENGDGEIVFSRCLPPDRVLCAAVYDQPSLEAGKPLEVLANPNCRTHSCP